MLGPRALPLQVTALVSRGGAPAQACTLLSGLDNPNGIAYDRSTKSLYVAEVGLLGRGDVWKRSAWPCRRCCLAGPCHAAPCPCHAQAVPVPSHYNAASGDRPAVLHHGMPHRAARCHDYCCRHMS